MPRTTNLLARDVARHLNDATAVNLANLVTLALLFTNRQALDESVLAQILDPYLALLRKVPYSPSATLSDGDGQALIEYVESVNLLAGRKDVLGRILRLDKQDVVLVTYYRSSVLHVPVLPALTTSFSQNNSWTNREQLLRLVRASYPYLQAELSIRWSLDELDVVIDQWLTALVEQGLLRQENNTFIRPAPSSRQYVLPIFLARSVTQTLQRFYTVIALLLNAGQNALTIEEPENLYTVIAQRLSILHGLNAPEFFDKSLFCHFIRALLDLRVLRRGEAGELSHHELFGELAEGAAKRVLPVEVRPSIRQVVLERPAKEVAAESNGAATI